MSDSVRPQRWQPTRLCCPWDSPGNNTGVGCHFLLQRMCIHLHIYVYIHLIGSVFWRILMQQCRRRQWHPAPVRLPGKSHGRRSLEGCSPWGRWGSETTEHLHFHFSLSCIGEGNGNPLQCSCLENARDGGAWWAAVYGVTQSWTRLKRFSSSSSSILVLSSRSVQESNQFNIHHMIFLRVKKN